MAALWTAGEHGEARRCLLDVFAEFARLRLVIPALLPLIVPIEAAIADGSPGRLAHAARLLGSADRIANRLAVTSGPYWDARSARARNTLAAGPGTDALAAFLSEGASLDVPETLALAADWPVS